MVRALRLQALAAAASGLPSAGPRVLVGPGENAGALDIGDGLAVVFKVESHNHPSAIEPYQGAATGVGGIIRDIFTMGARPIALLNSLRFGPLDPADDPTGRTDAATATRNRHLFGGVVAGIAGYGNCIGIPDVAGEIAFDPGFSGNPLVNAMCVGVARHEDITLARAAGVGNALMLVGAATGRDGIQGASFASAGLDEDSEERRPAVQVGNPFLEKLLMEACLALSSSEAVVAMQDLGAAGLTCALAELSARGGCGAEVLLDLVPVREPEMTGYELLLSESQERMLLVVMAGHEEEVRQAFARYELHAVTIGRVIEEPVIRARYRGELMCEVPGRALADDAPRYVLPAAPPAELELRRAERLDDLAASAPDGATLLELLASPNVRSRRPVWRRYDHMNGTNTLVGPGDGDAAVLRVKGTPRALALSIDGPGRLGALDPRLAGAAAVLEGALNVACSGAEPIGITDCLNFGSPETPEGYWQLAEAVGGMADACRALDLPIVSGNVSLYNETPDGPILPTPVVGTVGLLEDRSRLVPMRWRRAMRSGCSAKRGWIRARWRPPSLPGGRAGAGGRRGWRSTPLPGPWSAAGCAGRRGHPVRCARPVGRRAGGGPGAHGDRLRLRCGGQSAVGRRTVANRRAFRRAHRTRPGGCRAGPRAARCGRGGAMRALPAERLGTAQGRELTIQLPGSSLQLSVEALASAWETPF